MKKLIILFTMICFLAVPAVLKGEKISTITKVGKPEAIAFGNGNFYILEQTSVYIYDGKTFKFKKKFGKDGEGPGEIKKQPFGGPLLMMPHNGKVIISSMGKFSTFSAEGVFEKEVKISPADAFYPFEDKYICMAPFVKDQNTMVLAIYNADKNLKKADKPSFISDIQVGQNASFIFPFTAFFPLPYKDKLYLAPTTDKFEIQVYNRDIKQIGTIKKDYDLIKMTGQYRSKSIKWFQTDPTWKNIYSFFKDRISFRDYFPPIMALVPDSDKLYVFTYNFDQNGDRECIVLNLEGKEIKRLFLPVKENYGMDFTAPYIFFEDRFYILKEDLEEETWEIHKISL